MSKICLSLMAMLIIAGCKSADTKSESASEGKAASAPFQIRNYETQVLKNGLTVLWIHDNSLPYVSLQLMIETGSSQDPAGKEGLAAFTGAMLERGTQKRKAMEIAEDLEQIGSGFDVEVQPDYMVASTSALSFNRDEALNLFHEILLTPKFPSAEVELHRKIALAGLSKLADHPEEFTEYLLPKFLYGNHPYGHQAAGNPASVKGMKAEDLKAFYGQHFTPANAVLAVTGQYDDAWKQKVVQAFEGWENKKDTVADIPDFPQWKGLELLLVDRPDLNQAQIQIGFKGIPRNIPEYMELRAALKILGESFGSRLFDEIRVKRGLTYGIYSWFDPRLKPGPMGIYTFTRVEKVGETVQQTLNTYRLFVKDGVTDDEVATVKALMRGQFPRLFETPEALARQLLILHRYGISGDYLKNYLTNLNAITKASVNAAIKKYFDPDNLKVLVYAPRKAAEESLKSLGKIEVKSYRDFLN